MLGMILLDYRSLAGETPSCFVGRSAVCLRFKCTMCKKESCAIGMFFFAAGDLGGATPWKLYVRNMMIWTRELL